MISIKKNTNNWDIHRLDDYVVISLIDLQRAVLDIDIEAMLKVHIHVMDYMFDFYL